MRTVFVCVFVDSKLLDRDININQQTNFGWGGFKRIGLVGIYWAQMNSFELGVDRNGLGWIRTDWVGSVGLCGIGWIRLGLPRLQDWFRLEEGGISWAGLQQIVKRLSWIRFSSVWDVGNWHTRWTQSRLIWLCNGGNVWGLCWADVAQKGRCQPWHFSNSSILAWAILGHILCFW